VNGLSSMSLMSGPPAKRILIVEDDDDNRKILVYRLRRLDGVELAEAVNGLDAVEQAAADLPDLIIMDIHMPVMDGFEAAQRIRAMGGAAARVPIIALTAEELARAALTGGASAVTDYLQKPIVDPAILNAKILFWLGRTHNDTLRSVPAQVGLPS